MPSHELQDSVAAQKGGKCRSKKEGLLTSHSLKRRKGEAKAKVHGEG